MASRRGKNRIVAALTAIFGGFIGLHKFYLRDFGGGFFFVFLFIITRSFFPITTLFGFIEGFRLLMMNDEQFDRTYNRNILRNQRRPGSVEDRRYKQMQRARHRNIPTDRERVRREERRRKVNRSSRSNPFKKSGIKKHKDFDLEAAIEDFKQGLLISPNDIALHFNIAASYSLTEQKELAYHHLNKAVKLGFNDFKRIESHDDLAYVRIQPEFEAFKNSQYQNNPFVSPPQEEERQLVDETIEQLPQDDKLLSQLNKLAELRKKGLLSEEEFAMERKKLMRR